MTMGEYIKKLRLEHGYSQEKFGELVGVQKSAVAKWENGRVQNMKRSMIIKIANVLGTSPTDLLQITGKYDEPSNIVQLTSSNTRRIPLIGGIAAGDPVYDETVGVYVATDMDKANYAMKVEGDSMMPTFLDGDIVYLREQPDVEDGQIGAVQTEEGWRLKHIHHLKDGLLLISENSHYPPVMVTAEEQPRILGLAIGYMRAIK